MTKASLFLSMVVAIAVALVASTFSFQQSSRSLAIREVSRTMV
jgi:hypothetical protein